MNLVVVAEGDDFGGGNEVAKVISERSCPMQISGCASSDIFNGAVHPPASTGLSPAGWVIMLLSA